MAHQSKGKRGKAPSRWHEIKRSAERLPPRPIRKHAKHPMRGDGKRAALAQ